MRSFAKADLKEHGFAPTPMPSYQRRLDSAGDGRRGQLSRLAQRQGQSMIVRACLLVFLAAASLAGAGYVRSRSARRSRARELAQLLGHAVNQRFSPLTQITPANAKNLQLQWVWQARSLEKFEATALVVDGVLYTVQAPNDVVALDAVTGRVFWTFIASARAGCANLLRPRESRACDPWRHALHGHDRRASARDRRQERRVDLGYDRRELGPAILHYALAARRQATR